MVLASVATGGLLGIALGQWLGSMLTQLYAEFFRFPAFEHRISPELVLLALLLSVATAVLGTLNAIAATVRLAPAEAMRPPAPGHYRQALLERVLPGRLSPALRMILRNIERRPLRACITTGGIAAFRFSCSGFRSRSRRHRAVSSAGSAGASKPIAEPRAPCNPQNPPRANSRVPSPRSRAAVRVSALPAATARETRAPRPVARPSHPVPRWLMQLPTWRA